MTTAQPLARDHAEDIAFVLSRRHENGADFWATPDGNLLKGCPFSTVDAAPLLAELGVPLDNPVLAGAVELIWAAWRDDGRFRLQPGRAIYPCQTAHAARALCLLGGADDPRMDVTLRQLAASKYVDGGWRCNKFSYGRGPETECSNPMPTLLALDAVRLAGRAGDPGLVDAVEFLLAHWQTRQPIGPCHYGIGTLFMQIEYPFGGYNLFQWVYTLSFYDQARADPRFLEALDALETRIVDGQVVVERVLRRFAKLEFCRKGQPSAEATSRDREILANLGR